ncbi:MAG: TRAP transporter small permease [Deltaproteobacteria bacterium]|nr:TRAP transporter small permease [Deltaproteobacteria bacterium]
MLFLLRRLNDLLERVALSTVVAMVAVMCSLIFAQAMGRYVFHFSITWSEELARFLLVWVSMLGGAIAARRRMHVGFESLVEALPAPAGYSARALAGSAAIFVVSVMAWHGFKLARFNMLQRSAALEWPMGVPYAAIPAGALLLVLFLLEELGNTVAGRGTHPPGGEQGEWS